ncbi:MAG: hypothetical protein NZ895_06755 [Archaeoglobaceae archaeon]|nr:hypothetical protein [Archaeoglobaceae archaeon]MCX8152248.1 hypothetical protein [Archaeoglobaceae archaeon]MDW8013926.1 hypothetical protein [Archaeoglobaceae archaeon]
MFFTDWEGCWVLNDFAYELTMAVFNNDRFYRVLSEYDDHLAYTIKKPGYEAGYTVKLVVPFLIAAKVRNSFVLEFAKKVVKFVRDAKDSIEILKKFEPVVLSTSYVHFLKVSAEMLGIKRIHGTEVDFDLEVDSEILKEVDRIASSRFEEIEEIFSRKEVLDVLEKIKVVGAGEKAKILRNYCEEFNVDFPIAVGDSISDYKMFDAAKELGGVAIAFNGNEYALKHADIAIISESALSEALVIKKLIETKKVESLADIKIPGEIYFLEKCDFEKVLRKSKKMRVKIRSKAGELS